MSAPRRPWDDSPNGQRRRATYASVTVAGILIGAKLAAYLLTDSVTMLSALLDSTIDLIAALVNMFGVALALQPPDSDHRFGHAKAEPLAALAQAAFIVGSAVLLGYDALDRLYHPHAIQNEPVGYAAVVLAILLTLGLLAYQKKVVRRTGSMAIAADRRHYLGDLALNTAVVAAFALYQETGLAWLDPAFALAVAVGLAVNALGICRDALHVLMDKELPEDHRAVIQAIAALHPQVMGIHDLRTRSDSERLFISFHVELDGEMKVRDSYQVVAALAKSIRRQFPRADVLIHQDPAGLEEVRLDEEIETRMGR